VSVWFHLPCFFQKEKGKLLSVDDLKGYENLRIEDQVKIRDLVKEGLPAGYVAPSSSSASSAPSGSGEDVSGVTSENAALAAENNKKLWALRDKIEKDDVPMKGLKTLLDLNGMPSTGGRPDLVNRLSDAMLFGVPTCPACQQRDMVFSMGQYNCKADTTFGSCGFKGLNRASGGRVEVKPIVTDKDSEFQWIRDWNQPLLPREKRVVSRAAVTEYTRDAAQPLRSMKFSAIGDLERDKETIQALIINNGGSFAEDIQADTDYVITTYEDVLRAQNMSGSYSNLPQEIKVSDNGVSISSSTPGSNSGSPQKSHKESLAEQEANAKKLRAQTTEKLRLAMDMKLALVTEPLLDHLLVSFGFDQSVYVLFGNLPPIAKAKLATPASIFPTPADVKAVPSAISSSIANTEEMAKQAAPAKKAAPAPVEVKLTARGIVDDKVSGASNAKVHRVAIVKPKDASEEKEAKFDATSFESMKEPKVEKEEFEYYDYMLSAADVLTGINKWYRLQIVELEKNSPVRFIFFTRWGRVGEPGNWTQTAATGLQEAYKAWAKKWLEKTKNNWSDREKFEKKPGAYSPVEAEVEDQDTKASGSADADNEDSLGASSSNEGGDLVPPSYLDPRLKNLVDMIFDTNMLVKSMTELKIDVKKMPLGKLHRGNLMNGYSTLKEIEQALLSTDEMARFKLPSLSSKFYTYVPHDFGRNAPEIIDNFSLLKLKMKQLETLLDILIASELLKEKEPLIQKNPSDLNYQKMKVELVPLSSYTREFKLVQKFLSSGYNPKTLGKTLSVVDIFKVDREGEKDRFEPFRTQRPRKLLWHGSRVCNFVGILSSGLRIAPPEAPASGYVFGKAIYLSDLVEKSAPYCCPDPETGIGLMLLCDTALGEPLLLNRPEYITELPEGKQSAKALARFQPDPTKEELGDDKVIVPIGAPTPTDLPDVFLDHAEYMVYDAAQVRIRYLVQVQFSKDGTLAAAK
jgi:poly [ADP-ribose] polymerase